MAILKKGVHLFQGYHHFGAHRFPWVFTSQDTTLEAKEAVKMAAQTQNLTAGGGGGGGGGCCFVKAGSEFMNSSLGGGNSHILLMSIPTWGRWTQFDSHFFDGLKPPTSLFFLVLIDSWTSLDFFPTILYKNDLKCSVTWSSWTWIVLWKGGKNTWAMKKTLVV